MQRVPLVHGGLTILVMLVAKFRRAVPDQAAKGTPHCTATFWGQEKINMLTYVRNSELLHSPWNKRTTPESARVPELENISQEPDFQSLLFQPTLHGSKAHKTAKKLRLRSDFQNILAAKQIVCTTVVLARCKMADFDNLTRSDAKQQKWVKFYSNWCKIK